MFGPLLLATPEPLHPSRRTVARGAAWSVPAIAVGAAAPALAASGCPTLPPFSAADGWVLTESGPPSGGGAQFLDGTFFVQSDAHPDETYTATATHDLDVVAGQGYTFLYDWTAFTGNEHPMTSVLLVDDAPVAGSTVDTSSSGPNGSVSAAYVAPSTGTVRVAVQMSTSSPGGGVGDDMTVEAITVDCSGPA